MAVFPSLILEDSLQVLDKTRFDATSSSISLGASPLTVLSVQPGDDQSAVDILAAVDKYVDWQFNTWTGDFDATNNKLDFVEAGVAKVATITPNTYTLATLAVEVETQLNTAGTNTYVVVVSNDDKISITTNVSFRILPYTGVSVNNGTLQILGFRSENLDDRDFSNNTQFIGRRVRWLPKFITVALDNGVDSLSIKKVLKLYSAPGDALFSSDQDLVSKKSDIMKWVKPGRSSFLNFHRAAQEEIIDWFRGEKFVNIYGDPLTIRNFVKPDDLNQWSVFLTLRLIFDDFSNATDDIFYKEARQFESREMRLRDRYMRIDNDLSGDAESGEGVDTSSGRLIRR